MALYPDISHHHPVHNWNSVKQNVGFLISKATQGTSYIDSTLNSFIKNCEANKIPYWLYTYLNNGNEKAQAQYMVNICKGKVGPCFVGYILDIEEGNPTSGVREALSYLSGLGVKTMLYTMYARHSQYKSVIDSRPSSCAWWEARYGKNNGTYSSLYPCHSGVDLHQYTSSGVCAGISGRCDLSRLTGTKPESWFTTGNKATENPQPSSEASNENHIHYRAHCQTYGWLSTVRDGQISGTTGLAKRLEAMKIDLRSCVFPGLKLLLRLHIQGDGWKEYKISSDTHDAILGTTGKSKRIEAMAIEVLGGLPKGYKIQYCVHEAKYGWTQWIDAPNATGTVGIGLRVEAFKIRIVKAA